MKLKWHKQEPPISDYIRRESNDSKHISKVANILNPEEQVLVVAKQYKHRPGGSTFAPNTVYATDRRIIIRDPYMLGMKEKIVDIPYHTISTAKLERGLFSSTVKFFTYIGKVSIDTIPKDKAEDLLEVIRRSRESDMISQDDDGTYHYKKSHMQREQEQPQNSELGDTGIYS